MMQLELGKLLQVDARSIAKIKNPCIRAYGPGPEGGRCKDCDLLVVLEYSKRYFECRLRPFTNGPGTDHRVNWPACGKFEDTKG